MSLLPSEDKRDITNNSRAQTHGIMNNLATEDRSSDNRISPNSSMLMSVLNPQTRSRSSSPSRPLLAPNEAAPMARVETDEEIDDREVINRPYPGVDDGFFSNGNNSGSNGNKPTEDSGDPDVEMIPIRPKEPEDIDVPDITPRVGPDGGSVNRDDPNPPAEVPKQPPVHFPDFPQSPGFRPWGWDVEVGSTLPSGETIPDVNVYQHKKTLAQGMMDLALFSANANQLRYVVETFRSHPYFYPSVIFISLSLLLQVAVGAGLVWNATYNIRDQKALCVANRINNFTTICVFFITVINVFISAFGVAPAPS